MPLHFHHIKLPLAIIINSLLLPSSMAYAEWTESYLESEATYRFQDNINHSMFSHEKQTEHSWNALLTAGRVYQLTNYTRLLFNLRVDGSIHSNFEKLDQTNLAGNLAIRHKLGMGAYQPWVGASVSTGYTFSKSRLRSGQITHVSVDMGKRLFERLSMSLNYRFDYRNSQAATSLASNKLIAAGVSSNKSSSVFDTQGHSIGVQFNTLLTQQWVLILAYQYRDGDIISSSQPRLIPKLDRIIDAIAFDDALPGWAYRAKAQSHSYSIDANYAFLAGHAAISIGYQFNDTHASPFSYQNNMAHLNLMYSF